MKKLYAFLAAVIITAFTFGQTTIVEWSFPEGSADLIADAGIAENLNKEIYTEGGTSEIQFKNGYEDKAAQATSWENGENLKAWVVSFTSMGYGDLQVSSLQSSGGNDPGPRDFKLQYRIAENGEWTDVENAAIEVQNDWTTGVLDAVELPEACNNQELVFLRWIMTSNTNSLGDPVESNGKSKIDNIIITGQDNTGISEKFFAELEIYPNPCIASFRIKSRSETGKIEIFNTAGQLAYATYVTSSTQQIAIDELEKGFYVIVIWDKSNEYNISRKLLIQ